MRSPGTRTWTWTWRTLLARAGVRKEKVLLVSSGQEGTRVPIAMLCMLGSVGYT